MAQMMATLINQNAGGETSALRVAKHPPAGCTVVLLLGKERSQKRYTRLKR